MLGWQKLCLLLFSALNAGVFLKGWNEAVKKRNPYGKSKYISWLGIFVWGDAVIFGLFLSLISLTTLLLNDWYLFWLIISVYWSVRNIGETIYWLNEQFSDRKHNPPKTLTGYRFFPNDSIWFIYQIYWQCMTVISVVATIYCAHVWLESRF